MLGRASLVLRLAALASVACAVILVSGAARGDGGTIYWEEHFDHTPLRWVDPFDHAASKLAQVYSVGHEGSLFFLHARHDYTVHSPVPAMDLGMAFQHDAAPLERVRALKWRWRAIRHPNLRADDDAWLDMALGIYVVIRVPSLLKGGRGFKFGWLAKAASPGTYQRGLLQVPLRHEPAGPEWHEESVDLCGLYRHEYGPCEGEHVQYVGVTTDADGTKSVAEGDYADFAIVTSP
jgi:hypothetical protein